MTFGMVALISVVVVSALVFTAPPLTTIPSLSPSSITTNSVKFQSPVTPKDNPMGLDVYEIDLDAPPVMRFVQVSSDFKDPLH
jgi:hypothetical protein